MNDNTNIESGAVSGAARLDQTAFRGIIAIAVIVALIAAVLAWGATTGAAWAQSLLGSGWLMTIIVVVMALAILFVVDLARPKNIAWRSLSLKFGQAFREVPDRDHLSAGRAQFGDNWYSGVRCFASAEGLEVNRIVSPVNPPLSIPWSAIAKIDTFPSLLTGRQGFETDMQAQINLHEMPALTIEVPWLTDFRKFLPKSVRYRAIKLSKK